MTMSCVCSWGIVTFVKPLPRAQICIIATQKDTVPSMGLAAWGQPASWLQNHLNTTVLSSILIPVYRWGN